MTRLFSGDKIVLARGFDGEIVAAKVGTPDDVDQLIIPALAADGIVVAARVLPIADRYLHGLPVRPADGGIITVTRMVTGFLKLTAPAVIERGSAFNLTIQGLLVDGTNDTSYVPPGDIAGRVYLSVESDDAETISPLYTDGTGWSNGAKTVSCTISNGTGRHMLIIKAYDSNTDRQGYTEVSIAPGSPSEQAPYAGETTVTVVWPEISFVEAIYKLGAWHYQTKTRPAGDYEVTLTNNGSDVMESGVVGYSEEHDPPQGNPAYQWWFELTYDLDTDESHISLVCAEYNVYPGWAAYGDPSARFYNGLPLAGDDAWNVPSICHCSNTFFGTYVQAVPDAIEVWWETPP